jgi:hypothetical protein
VVATALPFRASTVPFAAVAASWPIIVNLLAGSLACAWVGAGWATRLKSETLYRIIAVLLVLIAGVLLFAHDAVAGSPPFTGAALMIAGIVAGFVIGVIASLLGVAGGEFLIPTLVLLFGADIKLAGSLSLTVSLPTMLVGFTCYSMDDSFSVIGRNKLFLLVMVAAGSTRATVAKKPGHRGEHEVSRKPLRRESRAVSGSPVVPLPCFFCTGPMGAMGTRLSPAPSVQGGPKWMQSSDASRRENADAYPRTLSSCPATGSRLRRARRQASAGQPVRRGLSALVRSPLECWIVRSSRTMTAERLFEIESKVCDGVCKTLRRRPDKQATASADPGPYPQAAIVLANGGRPSTTEAGGYGPRRSLAFAGATWGDTRNPTPRARNRPPRLHFPSPNSPLVTRH